MTELTPPPDVAGLLAYLLSIYPSATFDPETKSFVPASAQLSSVSAAATSTLYAVVHANLPSWAAAFLPAPQAVIAQVSGFASRMTFSTVGLSVTQDELAPIPTILTPAQLKAAILALSTKDVLTDLPKNTVNKLIFNNATDLKY